MLSSEWLYSINYHFNSSSEFQQFNKSILLSEVTEALAHLPFHTSTVDVVPPTVRGLPQTLRRGLAFKWPQAVGSILLAVVAPGCNNDLSVGALEVEALAVAVHPAHVMMVVGLSCHCCQQRQCQYHGSRNHAEEESLCLLHVNTAASLQTPPRLFKSRCFNPRSDV